MASCCPHILHTGTSSTFSMIMTESKSLGGCDIEGETLTRSLRDRINGTLCLLHSEIGEGRKIIYSRLRGVSYLFPKELNKLSFPEGDVLHAECHQTTVLAQPQPSGWFYFPRSPIVPEHHTSCSTACHSPPEPSRSHTRPHSDQPTRQSHQLLRLI